MIATKFVTWHNNCVVLLCAKLCCKLVSRDGITTRQTFHQIWTVSKELLVKLVPYKNSAWASYQIRSIAGCACAGNAGNVFPHRRLQRKPLVSDPAMHHDTCVTHVPWCMSRSLSPGGGENVPGIPGACATRNVSYLARGPWLFTWRVQHQGPWVCCIGGRLNQNVCGAPSNTTND